MRVSGNARYVGLAVAFLAVLAAGGRAFQLRSTRPSTPVVWACGESLKVRPDALALRRNSVWDAGTRVIRLFGARQEYVGFQVIVGAGETPLKDVQVRVSLLTSGSAKLGAKNIDLFRQHYLKVIVRSQADNDHPVPEAATGEFPVQMVPLRDPAPGKKFDVPAGRSQPVWVDLYLPEDQAPGDYRGEVQVTTAGRPLASLPLQLTVWRFALPRETHLKTFMYTGPENLRWAFGLRPEQDRELRQLEDRFFQMAHQHRLNFQPSASEDAVGEWGGRYRAYLDGTAFRERAGRGVGQNLVVAGPGGTTTEEIGRSARRVVDWWKAGRFRGSLACYVYDEPHSDEDFATVAMRARAIRAAVGRELPTYLTTVTPRKVPDGLIDIWGEAPAEEVARRQARGEKFWATNSGYAAAVLVDTPGYSGRTQGWMAWKMKLDAWHAWDCCYWTDKQNLRRDGRRLRYQEINADPQRLLTDTWNNPLTFDEQRKDPGYRWPIRMNGDGVLFYPGRPVGLNEPLAGFTLKSLRRGLQDYEYLWLLRQRGKPADDVVDRMVPRPHQWNRDPDAWDAARLELGRRLDAATREHAPAGRRNRIGP